MTAAVAKNIQVDSLPSTAIAANKAAQRSRRLSAAPIAANTKLYANPSLVVITRLFQAPGTNGTKAPAHAGPPNRRAISPTESAPTNSAATLVTISATISAPPLAPAATVPATSGRIGRCNRYRGRSRSAAEAWGDHGWRAIA
jgi:hypothetical protein